MTASWCFPCVRTSRLATSSSLRSAAALTTNPEQVGVVRATLEAANYLVVEMTNHPSLIADALFYSYLN